ncbi:LacI family DNA-binding transcriptional regulator [Bifidobacterium sp. ESL0690]|uniref:LacI family DNA-binding transcriptional regulator n=1 Tax=Bifidobacterium sp. ESL0690 TaxID=2983214 RepID=UPI0023F67862|nr:LacI family DNA-binding transcriptional regulator [Bifidobacterium sp. ESL0690]WEV46921.1 LacI family DNA-binding transcriptional regulator [Bifidobacterium sp. ESL0690]
MGSGEHITIKDVAKYAGVSFKTVSNVLNDTGSMRPETRRRVEEAIRSLGYTVNVSARSLRKGGSKLIGVGIFDFSQPFGPYFVDKVIEVARESGYGTIIDTYGSGGKGLSLIVNELSQLGADGWILFADQPVGKGGKLLQQPFPIVLTGDYLPYGNTDWVTMPNTEALRYVTGQLLDSGCTSIAVVGAKEKPETRDYYMSALQGTQDLRIKGYIEAFEERGLKVDSNMLIPRDWMIREGGMHAVDIMLERDVHPDAIVCLTDAVALGVLHGLQAHGIRVPEDVQVVGFDNVPESTYSTPALTTIDTSLDDYVRTGVKMLIERINGYDGPVRKHVTRFKLVKRDSTLF